MTSSRLGRLGVPIGVGAAVLALTLATLVDRGGDGPARLPIGLASGRNSAGTAGEADAAAPAAPGKAYYGGNVTYRFAAGTLEGLAKEGRAYRLSDGRADQADVARLASALGLDGEPAHSGDTWVVREGSRELRVSDSPGNPWYFSPYARVDCAEGGGSSSGSGSSGGAPEPDAPPPPPDGAEPADQPLAGGDVRCAKPVPPPDAPTTDPGPNGTPAPEPAKPDQVCAAPPVPGTSADPADQPCNDTPTSTSSGDTGCDTCVSSGGTSTGTSGSGVACGCPEGVKCACAQPSPVALGPESEARAKAVSVLKASGHDDVDLHVERGYDAWYVSGDISVGGLRTIGFGVHVGVDAKGEVRDANGWLGSAEGADTYPLLDPEAAAKRNPWGGGVRPMMACDAMTPECQAQDVVRDVTAVELGLLFAPVLSSDQENAYLVPAWLLTMKDQPAQYPEPVIALPDEYIQQPQPVDSDGGCNVKDACDQPVCDTPDGSCGDPGRDDGATVVAPAQPQTDPAVGAPETAKS
jgi:hypothetical protein